MANENKYIKASADIVVKYLLGVPETEKALISFINAVLEDSGFDPINSVTILNPFNIKNFVNDKVSVLDIRAKDNKEKVFNIEIQSTGDSHFKNRSLFYWSRLYSSEIKESEIYKELDPVICINLLGYELFSGSDKIHTCFLLKEKDDNFILTEHLEIHFIELSKLKGFTGSSQLEQWLLYLKYEGNPEPEARKYVEEVFKMNPEIKSTHKRYEQFTSDDEMRELYEARVKYQRDVASLIDSGYERGKLADKQEMLIRLINIKFNITEENRKKVLSESRSEVLINAIETFALTDTLDEIMKLFQ